MLLMEKEALSAMELQDWKVWTGSRSMKPMVGCRALIVVR
jgi:hypothetical protein